MVSQDHDDSLVGGVHSGHHVGDEVDEIAQNVQSGDRLFCCCGGVLFGRPFFYAIKKTQTFQMGSSGFSHNNSSRARETIVFFMKKFIL